VCHTGTTMPRQGNGGQITEALVQIPAQLQVERPPKCPRSNQLADAVWPVLKSVAFGEIAEVLFCFR
jgi:hypothetical protein